jgi:GT2 family glycosyltransferase
MTGIIAGNVPPAGDYDADILILSLDRVADTEAAIRSALGQNGISRHLIVFDQGSAPENLARLAALVDGRPDALLASAGANLGVAEGRNRATALGAGRALIVIDNDAVFADATTAARAVALLDEEPTLAAIGFRIMNGDGSGEDHASWGYPEALRPQAGARFAAATFVGAGHAIRRAAWDAVGGYDARLFFTWEEYDFSLRAIDQGWRLLHAGDIAVHHKLAIEGRVGWTGRRWFLFVRNRLYIERKWRPARAAMLGRAAAYGLKSLRVGLGAQGCKAVVAAFRMPLPEPPRRMSAEGRAYVRAADTAWRGGAWARLRGEVMAGLPSSRPRQPRNRAVTNGS